jgi:protein-S-isoprenylcysteine O-methyltransferase Ste14
MYLLDETILGILILFLLAALVAVKWYATGAVLDRPAGSPMVQLVNVFNLFFLLVVNPLTALLLLTGHLGALDPAPITIPQTWLRSALEIVGLAAYVSGFVIMGAALIALGRNYQLGGSAPRSEDALVTGGPYRLVRHPMYTAALSISLGLALLLHSWAFLAIFCVYIALFLPLIPMEEERLRKAYGESYVAYEKETKRLVPLVY